MDQMPVILGLLVMVGLLTVSVPIVAALGLGTLTTLYLCDLPYQVLMNRMFEGCQSFPLLAVPFFILAGEIMGRGTMAEKLLRFSRTLVGHFTGGLGHISVLTCMFYGALCGSSPATVSAVGGMLIPNMRKENYPVDYSTALNCTSGCLGVLIPPSCPLIVYGCLANVSISDLFLAGIMPGIFIGFVLMIVNYVICKRKGYGNKMKKATGREILAALGEAKYALAVPAIILGGIYGGIFSPSEAGAIAVAYSLVIECFVTKTMTAKILWQVFKSSTITTAMIFIIIAVAMALGQIYVVCNSIEVVSGLFSGISNKYALLAVMIVVYLILGTFLDLIPILVLTLPLFVPALQSAGVDLIHFGVVAITALSIGFMTPPVGLNLYVGVGISNLPLTRLSVAILPFIAVMFVCLFMLAIFPQFCLCLV